MEKMDYGRISTIIYNIWEEEDIDTVEELLDHLNQLADQEEFKYIWWERTKMKSYLCLKDWEIDSGIYFQEGKTYKGKVYNDGKSVEMQGEVGMKINFHEGSEYFNI